MSKENNETNFLKFNEDDLKELRRLKSENTGIFLNNEYTEATLYIHCKEEVEPTLAKLNPNKWSMSKIDGKSNEEDFVYYLITKKVATVGSVVKLIAYTPEPEKLIATAARVCYSNDPVDTIMDNFTDEKVSSFIGKLVDMGHESPFEHASFTFAIDEVSRALLAQETRHRLASYSVRSQRYCKMDSDNKFIIPSLKNAKLYKNSYNASITTYNELLEKGEKKENARMVLPEGSNTLIMVTMNARELMHFFNLRCCTHAQWEIRAVANKMLKLVKEVAPVLFKNAGPTCVQKGYCPEGIRSCGKAPTLKKLLDVYYGRK